MEVSWRTLGLRLFDRPMNTDQESCCHEDSFYITQQNFQSAVVGSLHAGRASFSSHLCSNCGCLRLALRR